jgi:PAS domain S-box-containing protein
MPLDATRLRHELEIHQIELSVQDEELRRTQQELEASRERYFELYHYAPVGYCTIDEQGRILEANLRASTLLGTSLDALEWHPLVQFVLAEDQATFLHKQQLAFAGLTRESFEVNLRRVNGDTLTVWVVLAARMDDARGQEKVGLVALSDMTLAKKAERERQELQSQLFHTQKIESIGALTSTLAHDFNNLLTGIMGNLSLL